MKIALASDHAGFIFKEVLKEALSALDYEIYDFGCESKQSCDYPDYAIPAVMSVSYCENDRAILICGNGIGMSILANKIRGILAALVYDAESAQETRKHHGSNVLCLGARHFENDELLEFVRIWLNTEFDGGRHKSRIDKIKLLEIDAHDQED